MISQAIIENGGIDISLKAHAVCAKCTACDDFRGNPEAVTLAQFGVQAARHFQFLGWQIGFGGEQTLCQTCAA